MSDIDILVSAVDYASNKFIEISGKLDVLTAKTDRKSVV